MLSLSVVCFRYHRLGLFHHPGNAFGRTVLSSINIDQERGVMNGQTAIRLDV